MEFCFWYSCPEASHCVSLIDGHECISNATFNGVNSTLTYAPAFRYPTNLTTISAMFRTKANGTLLHVIHRQSQTFVKFSLTTDGQLRLEMPEMQEMRAYVYGNSLNNGQWHEVTVFFDGDITSVALDGNQSTEVTLSSDMDLFTYVLESSVVLGSTLDAEFHTSDHYRGCLGEVRIGGILLPYFTETELVNSTASKKFVLNDRMSVPAECKVCFQNECQNGGICLQPRDVFECSCPVGFEDPFCSSNIDECVSNACVHGVCIDGIANYTCSCPPGWSGWL